MKKRIASAALACLIALPAQAHEAEPLPEVPAWTVDAWLTEWAAEAIDTLDVESLGDWRWMRDTYRPAPPLRKPLQPPREPLAVSNVDPPRHSAYSGNVEQWRPLVAQFFRPENVEAALRVLGCESQGNPWADNPSSTAAGLFQFLRSTWDRVAVPLGYGSYDSGAVYDPVANVHAASVLSQGGSTWSQWACKP